MNRHRMISHILDDMEGSVAKYNDDNCEMVEYWDVYYETEDNCVCATLRLDGDDYIVSDVVVDSQVEKKHPRLEEALEGQKIDVSYMAKEIEERIEESKALERDPYAFYGVSRSDFV